MTQQSKTINIITGHLFGGILTVYKTLVPFLNNYYKVNIVTFNKKFSIEDDFFYGNEKLCLNIDPPLTGITAIMFIIKLYLISKRKKLTHYIINNPSTSILVYLLSLLINIDYIVHLHEPVSNSFKYKNKLIRKIYIDLLRRTFGKSLSIISVSKSVKNDFLNYFPNTHIDLVYNPISIHIILKDNAINPFLENYSISCKFVSVGRLSKAKDYVTLIHACRILKMKEVEDFNIFIVGDGEEFISLQGLIDEHHLSKNIKLIGYKENPIPYIRYCDCYVSSSQWEGFGLTIAYAMLLKKPIISSNTGGAIEILSKNNDFFDIGDFYELSYKMARYIKSRDQKIEVIEENYLQAMKFDAEMVSNHFIAILNQKIT